MTFSLSDAADKLDTLREEREKYIDDLPVLESTHADLARVVAHMVKYDKNKVRPRSIVRLALTRLLLPGDAFFVAVFLQAGT